MQSLKRIAQYALRHSRALIYDRSWTHQRARTVLDGLKYPVPSQFQTALFNFTIDFELFWANGRTANGWHSVARREKAARKQFENFGAFVALLDELNFPITWAIVGRLANPNAALMPHERFDPKWQQGNWYITPNEVGLPNAYGDGQLLFDYLQKTHVRHEVASHGYAHIDYADPSTTVEVAAADMAIAKQALGVRGYKAEAFIYPCHRHAHHELLSRTGHTIARGANDCWEIAADGTVFTPIGFCINPGFYSLQDLKRFVSAAVTSRSFLHPYMHLTECSLCEKDIDRFYRPFFECVLEEQKKGAMCLTSLGAIAERMQSAQSRALRLHSNG